MNKLSVFLAIVIFSGEEYFHGISADEYTIETTNFTGMWYAVMSTGCNDGKDCNIFTNNETPCECISANFRALQEYGWQVHMNAINNQSHMLTVDMGGASATSDDKIIQGFIYSRAIMPLSVISASPYLLTENVVGKEFFLRYKMTIIGSSVEYNYMITTMEKIDESNNDGKNNLLTVIWCHNKTPGKDTIWRQIVKHFKSLQLQIHDLKFINQMGCIYPTENQYNEMFFC